MQEMHQVEGREKREVKWRAIEGGEDNVGQDLTANVHVHCTLCT